MTHFRGTTAFDLNGKKLFGCNIILGNGNRCESEVILTNIGKYQDDVQLE